MEATGFKKSSRNKAAARSRRKRQHPPSDEGGLKNKRGLRF